MGRLLTVGAIALAVTLAAALVAFLCDRLGLRRPVAPVRVARGLRDWRTGSRVLAGGDRHVYDNHVDQFLEQLGREPYPYPTIEIRKADSLFDYQYEDFKVVGYQHRPIIKTPVAV